MRNCAVMKEFNEKKVGPLENHIKASNLFVIFFFSPLFAKQQHSFGKCKFVKN